MSTSNVNRPLHLLSLDGGGVRGLSSIIILQHLMENISRQRGRIVQPWEEFDMIGGTSTGGLIAIMLGRLRMSLGECENAYLDLSDRIFNPSRSKFDPRRSKDFLLANGKFDYRILEKVVKEIVVGNTSLDESALLKDPDPHCKVFVCATRTGNTEVAILRSYNTTEPKLLFEECKIWEACRATSAATTFFDPIKIGKYGQEFADGAVLYNNPIQLVELEASTIWPDRMENAILVSIGTGSAPGGTFKGNVIKVINAMKKIVTQTERTSEDFFLAHQSMFHQNRLYRFNVYPGLADVGLDEAKEKEKIANTTQTFLEKAETRSRAKLCVEQLCKPGSLVIGPSQVENVDREQGGPNSSDARDSQKAYFERELPNCLRSLSHASIDSRRNNISLAHRGTCEWLFGTPAFRKWKDRTDLESNNGVLWIKGHPGVGKSTLMKHTLLYCQKEFEDHNIALYFFNARGGTLERSPLGMLRSLMVQLLEQNPILVEKFIPMFVKKTRRHGNSGWGWETGELKEFLLHEYGKPQYKSTLLLIDALDECNDSDVQEVVDFLENLSENAMRSDSNLKICLSSRHYPHIDMKKKIELVVEKQAEHDQDIFKYIQGKLKAPDTNVQKRILENANHIFIWVVLVVEILNKEFNKGKIKAMWKKLNEIPSDIDELFSKILEKEDPEDDKETTVLLFQWVLFSFNTLKPTELYFAILAGTNPDDLGAWDRSRTDFEAIERFITDASRGLVEVVSDSEERRGKGQDIVQFIHQSVIDFLTRNQRLVKLDPTLGPNPVGASHARLASCCMSYIMQEELRSLAMDIALRVNSDQSDSDEGNSDEGNSDEGDSDESDSDESDPCEDESDETDLTASHPFLEYSVTGIFLHANDAQAEGIPQTSLLRQFEKYGAFQILQPLYDEFKSLEDRFQGAQPLYAVSLCGYYDLARALLLEPDADVNARGGHFGTALQAAAYIGSTNTVELLLERGANVNTQGGYFGTALQAAAYIGSTNTVEILLEHGANVNTEGGYFGTALQAAARNRCTDIVKLLLKHGANVNAQGGDYGNALQAAAHSSSIDTVELLLERGAYVNAHGGQFGTALQAAACMSSTNTVKLLLEHGANVNAQGGRYGTALQAAISRDYQVLIRLLRQHGAE